MKQLIKNITRKEWSFLIIISLILILIIFLPTIYALIITPPGYQFTGLKMPHAGDYWVFFSRIEQSLQGNIFHQYLYSSEYFPRILFLPVWTIMGLVGRALTFTSQQTFYFFQFILLPILVISLYVFISLFIKELVWKKITLLIILFTTGSDWLWWPVFKNKFNWLGIDLGLPDGHILTAVFNSPHLIFILIFICWLFVCILYLNKTKKIKYSWLAGFFCLFIFLSHPYQIIPILSVIITFYTYKIVIQKEVWLIKKLIPFIIINLFIGFYLFFLWSNFEVIRSWNINNQAGGYGGFDSIPLLISAFSLFLFLSFYKIFYIIKKKQVENYTFLIIWLVVGLIAIYLPIQWRGKMILGLSIPISILGVLGLRLIWRKIHFYLIRMAVIWLIVFLALPGGLYLIGHNIYLYYQASQIRESQYFLSKDLIDAFVWLKDISDESVILPLTYHAPAIPAFSGRKVYFGSNHETVDYDNKIIQTIKFYYKELDRSFLEKNKINYIFLDTTFGDLKRDYLQLIFNNSRVKIFQVINENE